MSEMFTGLLADIAEIAGETVAMQIASARGGTRVTIPPRAIMGHWLTELVGLEVADKICVALSYVDNEGRLKGVARETLSLGAAAMQSRLRAEVIRLLRENKNAAEIAMTLGVSERTIYRIKAEQKRPNLRNERKSVNLLRLGRSDGEVARATGLKIDEIRALRAQLSKKGKLPC